MWLGLGVWLGALLFFGAVVAPTAFAVLPTTHDAGVLVGASLRRLHVMGLVAGVVFLIGSLIAARILHGSPEWTASRNLLVVAMIGLTLLLNTVIIPRMDRLRQQVETEAGDIVNVPPTDPRRHTFDRLHILSTRVESGVLILGLGVLYLTVATVG